MAEFITVELKGLRELRPRIRGLADRVQRRIMNAALLAGGRVIVRAAKAAAPNRTGAVRRNILVKIAKQKMGYDNRAILGVRHGRVNTKRGSAYDKRGQDPFYWRFQEFGFRAIGRRGRQSRFERRTGVSRRSGAAFRQVAGKRFVTNAASNQAGAAFQAIQRSLADQLAKLRF